MIANIFLLSSLATVAVTAPANQTPRYTIEISDSGQISHAGKIIALESLETALTTYAKSAKDSQVLISASEHAPLRAVTTVMDTCRKVGITKFVLQGR